MRQQHRQPTEENAVLHGVENLPQETAESSSTALPGVTDNTEAEWVEQLEAAMRREVLARMIRVLLLPAAPVGVLFSLQFLLGDEAFVQLCTHPAFLFALVLSIGVAVPCAALRTFRKAREVASHLAESEDLRTVGPLIDALQFGEDPQYACPRFIRSCACCPGCAQATRTC